MKRHAVIVAIQAKHCDIEIIFFFPKNCRELEAFDGIVESVAKRRKHKPRSDTIRTLQFVQQVQDIIDEETLQSPYGPYGKIFKFLSTQFVVLSAKTSGTSPA